MNELVKTKRRWNALRDVFPLGCRPRSLSIAISAAERWKASCVCRLESGAELWMGTESSASEARSMTGLNLDSGKIAS